MRNVHLNLAGAAVVLLWGWAAVAGAQEESQGESKSPIYLRSPEDRATRLASFFDLGKSRKAKVRAILKEVDSGVRQKISAGNKKIRALLTAEEKATFDDLRDDTESGPQSTQQRRRLVPSSHLDSGGRGNMSGQGGSQSGGQGGSQSGGQGGGQSGGQSGGQGGGRSGGRSGGRGGGRGGGMGGGQSGGMGGGQSGGQGGSARGRCGDGICDQIEQSKGVCPEDCGQNQGSGSDR